MNTRPGLGAILIALSVVLLAVACEEDRVGTDPNGDNPTSGYAIETQPALAPNGTSIYFVATDTVGVDRSGIYRVLLPSLRRERLLAGAGYESPSPSLSGDTVAYLQNGTVHYVRPEDSTLWTSSITATFHSIAMLSDSILIGCRHGSYYYYDSLYLLNEKQGTTTVLAAGCDPTFVAPDTFAYLLHREGQAASILRSDAWWTSVDTLHTAYYLGSPGWARWPTIDPSSGRCAYVRAVYDGAAVHAATMSDVSSTMIDPVTYEKSCIVGSSAIVYTGPDGRLYRSDFDGSGIIPLWGQASGY